jgi:peptidoglycan hydrolase-like protein with peptidoglycan-binding domain
MKRWTSKYFYVAVILAFGGSQFSSPGNADELRHPIQLGEKCKASFEKFVDWQQYYKAFAYTTGPKGYACATDVGTDAAVEKCDDFNRGRCRVYAKSPVNGKVAIVWEGGGRESSQADAGDTAMPSRVPEFSGRIIPITQDIRVELTPGYRSKCNVDRKIMIPGKATTTQRGTKIYSVHDDPRGKRLNRIIQAENATMNIVDVVSNSNKIIDNKLEISALGIKISENSGNEKYRSVFDKAKAVVKDSAYFDLSFSGITIQNNAPFRVGGFEAILAALGFNTNGSQQNSHIRGLTKIGGRYNYVVVGGGSVKIEGAGVAGRWGGYFIIDIDSGLLSKSEFSADIDMLNNGKFHFYEHTSCQIFGPNVTAGRIAAREKAKAEEAQKAEEASAADARRQIEEEKIQLALLAKARKIAAVEARTREEKLADAQSKETRRERLLQAQTALNALGIYQGKIDGVFGRRSRAAVSEWLKQNGRSENAELTNEVVAKMQQQVGVEKARRLADANTVQGKFMKTLRQAHRHAVAVIIGNRDYSGRTPDVAFAGNDADAFRKFVAGDLGYREGNIIDLRDASLTQLNATFGTTGNHRGRLFDYVREGKSDVIVFYSGHGVPGMHDRKGYLLPVDADPNRAELNGYPLDVLLANLAKVPARSMAVYIDACFSGESQKGMLVQATSGITVQAKVPNSSKGMVVVTAAQNDQFASWDEDAKHGLFTKHLLEALRGKADNDGYGNGDGKVTLAELKAYLDEEMTYQARRRWSRDQNASVQGADGAVLSTLQQ